MSSLIPSNEPLIKDRLFSPLEIQSPEEKLQVQPSPKDNSNNPVLYPTTFISSLFFTWMYSPLKFASRFQIRLDFLGSISSRYNSQNYLNELKPKWYGKYQFQKRMPLFRAVLSANLLRVVFIFALSSIDTLLQLGRIYLFRQVLLSFQEHQSVQPIASLPQIILALLGITFTDLFILRHTEFLTVMTGSESTMQINTLLYDKLLKVAAFNNTVFSEGEMVNFIQIDSERFAELISTSPKTLLMPFQFGFYIYFLFQYFGASFLFGLISLVLILLLVSILQKRKLKLQKEQLQLRNARMKITAQTFNMIKIIKLYSWEEAFTAKIQTQRDKELEMMQRINNYNLFTNSLYWAAASIMSLISIIFYNVFNDQMDTANILTSIYIFNSLADPMFVFPDFFNGLFETLVAFKRMEKFLFSKDNDPSQIEQLDDSSRLSVQISRCSFGIEDQNEVQRELLHDVSLEVAKGELIAIVGEVGSGKTCLLNTLLNNLEVFNSSSKGKVKLSGRVSYVSQNPWILNDTVRNNILFFKPMNEEKYNKVLEICELTQDLKLFNGGDMTEIGERGIGLSGGQKARIAIARAIYNEADIYLFDDPLSALDAYIGMRIFNQVFLDFLKEKTRLVATHALQYISFTNKVIYMSQGRIEWFGGSKELETQKFYNDFIALSQKKKPNRQNDSQDSCKAVKKSKESKSEKVKAIGKKIVRMTKDEEQKKGAFSFKLWWQFYMFAGGIMYFALIIGVNALWKATEVGNDYFLTFWADQSTRLLLKNGNTMYLLIYVMISLCGTILIFFRAHFMNRGLFEYTKKMHTELLTKLMNAPINLFHDTIPRSQILNRLSKDLDSGSRLNNISSGTLRVFFQILACILILLMFNLWSLLIIPIVFITEVMIVRFYLSGSRDLNRLEGNTRSPMVSVFSETIPGVAIIRSYGYEDNFKNKFYRRLNDWFKVRLFQSGGAGWFGLHLDIISFVFLVFILGFAYIFKASFSSKAIGLLLTYSYKIIDYLFDAMGRYARVERVLTSVERCNQFTQIAQENPSKTKQDAQLKDFPADGAISFRNFYAKYRPDTELVLRNLTIDIKPGEKIGVVGRTGSGKSTLCLCLFRILEAHTGSIFIDGIDISSIGLSLLRRAITVIPQESTLIEGTLKENVDPTNEFTEEEAQSALKEVGLDHLNEMKSLDYVITENGNNISVGEKQLLCIARALLRKSKIVLMDEATSSIDFKTETLIQQSMSTVFKNSTVITVAHRIKTILSYDRILVLANGEVVEFDTPKILLENKDGVFSALYRESHV